ncbi:hypothetical protein H2198_001519 [Neophaeococcomyces mojaviensis]|uniref:Uncharacterized protein n=1 Tax=Neophaeococcomyces mojaviensis TaxID=3383035 RepID=A0ACC3AGV6_9EURO|nr:hypothetical protein H2198_001519 [Knufia sp. JES_112]
MDACKHRALSTPTVNPSTSQDGQVSNQVRDSPWTGIESREVVLRQFQNALHIMVIDSDDDEAPTPTWPAQKRRRLEDRVSPVKDGGQVLEKRYVLSTIPRSSEVEIDASRQRAPPTSKKRLFQSSEAKRSMFELSSAALPTPPTSPDDKSHRTEDIDRTDANGETSWGSDHVPEEPSLDTSVGNPESAAELSMQMSHLFKTPENQQSYTTTKATTNRMKSRVEAAGIARSQELRARRRQKVHIDTKVARGQTSSFASILREIDCTNSRDVTAVRLHNHVDVSHNEKDADVSSSTLSDAEREELLDIAQAYAYSNNPSRPTATAAEIVNKRLKRPSSTLNTFPRGAAEKFRSEHRHLNRSTTDRTDETRVITNDQSSVLLGIYANEQKRREQRLERIKHNAFTLPLVKKPKERERPPTHSPPRIFHAPDLGNNYQTSIGSARSQFNRQDLRKLMGTSKTSSESFPQSRVNGATSENIEDAETNPTRIWRPKVSLAMLEQFRTGRKDVANGDVQLSGCRPNIQDPYDTLPRQGIDLQLPKTYEKEPEHIQKKMEERETLKERIKDLVLISETFKQVARCGAVTSFQDTQLKQLAELKKFCDAVLIKQLAGKPIRKRIKDIQDNMKRRVRKQGVQPTAQKIDEVLEDIMQAEYIEHLDQIPVLEAQLLRVKLELQERHNQPKDKVQTTVHKSGKHKEKPRLSKSESSRLAFERSQDKRIMTLQEQLSKFPDATGMDNAEDSEMEVIDLGGSADDAQSVTSEEDEGGECMRPLGLEDKQVIATQEDLRMGQVESPEDRPQEKNLHGLQATPTQQMLSQQVTQAHDQGLFEQMLDKQRQRQHAAQQGAQEQNLQLLGEPMKRQRSEASKRKAQVEPESDQSEANNVSSIRNADGDIDVTSEREFEDSDIDVDEDQEGEIDEVENNHCQCWRYTVRLTECVGFVPDLAGYESEQGSFLSYTKAKASVEKHVAEMRRWYKDKHKTASDRYWNTETKEDDRTYEFVMTKSDNSGVGCRFLIEGELYHPSADAFEKARVRDACQPINAWFVDWERTIGVASNQVEDSESGGSANAGAQHSVADEAVEEQQDEEPTDAGDDGDRDDKRTPQPEPQPESTSVSAPENDRNNDNLIEDQSVSASGLQSVPPSDEQAPTPNDNTNQDDQISASAPATSNKYDDDNDEDSLFGSEPDFQTLTLEPTPPTSTSSNQQSPSSPPPPAPPPTCELSKTTLPLSQPPPPSTTPLAEPTQSAVPSPIITRATGDELCIFSSLAHANRHAADLFTEWFRIHFPDPQNHSLLKTTEDDIENELQMAQGTGEWSREEIILFEREDGVEMEDKYKVWVRKARSVGPRN